MGLEILSEEGMGALSPSAFAIGDENALVSKLPEDLENSILKSAKSVFDSVKMQYVSSLNSWASSLYLSLPRRPFPNESPYPEDAILTLERALENMRRFSFWVNAHGLFDLSTSRIGLMLLYYDYTTYRPHGRRTPENSISYKSYYRAKKLGISIPVSYTHLRAHET